MLGIALLFGLWLARIDPFTVFFFVWYAAVGAVLAIRRPRNSIGWLLVMLAFGFTGTTSPTVVDIAALRAGTATWSDFLIAWASGWVGFLTFGGLLALMLLFPSGHLPSGRWRRPATLVLAVCASVPVIAAFGPTVSMNPDGGTSVFAPNRLAFMPDLPLWQAIPGDALILPVVVCLAIGAISLFVRYRRAVGIERLQLRWLVAAVLFMVAAIITGLSALALFGDQIGGAAWIPAIVAYPTIPAAIYVAVLRYRLYEVDRIVSRAIGWTLLSVMLGAVFVAVVVGVQAALAPWTENNTLAVAASTLVAAALFQPLRRRVQMAVDRRFDRERFDGELVVAAFSDRLRDEVDLETLRVLVRDVAGRTVRPMSSAIWIRPGRGSDS
ncbi:MAG: hypothetical protein ABIR11_07435 [Candidatus Limnocylindrales bacterium]